MEKRPSLLATALLVLLISSCSSVRTTSPDVYPAKNPQAVSVYTKDQSPHTAYRVIGIANVSKYNFLGLPRQAATMQALLKQQAASIGGDGVINVSENDARMQANVIAFQKILI
jgi:hypothetical protein